MDAKRWGQIKGVYDCALDLRRDEREVFSPRPALHTTICAAKPNRSSSPTMTLENSFSCPRSRSPRGAHMHDFVPTAWRSVASSGGLNDQAGQSASHTRRDRVEVVITLGSPGSKSKWLIHMMHFLGAAGHLRR